ncbi:hypothetical protein C8D90_105111 [Enterobacillus tribolii]|uniref:Uncharacterized protein n=1 Tax=Enterobacillus tribolii TaxID=1487935 RepID=A0A370QPX1_9GAMM|nr:hypothetical protein C8D90_105111 [Enterobacillus tribolii]
MAAPNGKNTAMPDDGTAGNGQGSACHLFFADFS